MAAKFVGLQSFVLRTDFAGTGKKMLVLGGSEAGCWGGL